MEQTIDLRSARLPLVEVYSADATGQTPATVRAILDVRRLEYQTFFGAGYVDSYDELTDELAPYLNSSSFLVARSDDGSIAGAARVISHSAGGFKTLNDMKDGRLDGTTDSLPQDFRSENSFEIATLSIHPDHRHSLVGLLLYGAVISKSQMERKPYVIASFDDGPNESYLRDFEALFPEGVTRLGLPIDYMGTPTTPVCISVAQVLKYVDMNPPISEILRSVTLRYGVAPSAPTSEQASPAPVTQPIAQ